MAGVSFVQVSMRCTSKAMFAKGKRRQWTWDFGLINGSATASQGALGMIAGRNDGLMIDVNTYGTVRGGTSATGGWLG